MNDIIIDPGHGGKDPGVTSPTGITERDQVTELAKTVKHYAIQSGLEYEITRVSSTSKPSFAKRTGRKGKLFLSLHLDIPKTGARWGVYYSDQEDSKSLAIELAKNLFKVSQGITPWVRSHRESRFGQLYINDFDGPSVMVEFGPVRLLKKEERIAMVEAIWPTILKFVGKGADNE